MNSNEQFFRDPKHGSGSPRVYEDKIIIITINNIFNLLLLS